MLLPLTNISLIFASIRSTIQLLSERFKQGPLGLTKSSKNVLSTLVALIKGFKNNQTKCGTYCLNVMKYAGRYILITSAGAIKEG